MGWLHMKTSLSQYMHEPYPCFPAIATVMAVHCESSTAKLKCCSEPFPSGSRQIPIARGSNGCAGVARTRWGLPISLGGGTQM